jgi:hypothetical protein
MSLTAASLKAESDGPACSLWPPSLMHRISITRIGDKQGITMKRRRLLRPAHRDPLPLGPALLRGVRAGGLGAQPVDRGGRCGRHRHAYQDPPVVRRRSVAPGVQLEIGQRPLQ